MDPTTTNGYPDIPDLDLDSLADFYLENDETWTLTEHFHSLNISSPDSGDDDKENDDWIRHQQYKRNHLRLDTVIMDMEEVEVNLSGFHKGRNLGYFSTADSAGILSENEDQTQVQCVEDMDAPNVDVLPSTLLPKAQILALNGTDLSVGFKNSKKILNYEEFHTLKHVAFQKWLVAHKSVLNHAHKDKDTKITWVCNVGRIANILVTPMIPEDSWEFYALRYDDNIFLFNAAPEKRTVTTVPSHCGIVYKRLVTGENPKVEGVDEFDKVWAVTESGIGDHKFILLTGGQVDCRGRKVNTRAYNPRMFANWRLENKFLNYWAVTAAAGAQHLLLGTRNHRHILEHSELLSLNSIWNKTGLSKNDQERCYHFTCSVLSWIQGHFVENDRYLVKHFGWAGQDKETKLWADEFFPFSVECNTVTDEETYLYISNQILPEFFIKGTLQDEKKF